ncbi:lantibiotic dehydratase [Nocardia sp. NPDC046473]|uniref:lantibiotic dehydratase n=1 Tax=Nocardia sp. NPDC046473 TaxID=3155733 RepID=UPI0033C59036
MGGRGLVTRIQVFPEAVLRCAALPAETLLPFAAAELVRAAREVAAAQRAIEANRANLVELLHRAVPRAADTSTRRVLLHIKRRVHGTVDTLDRLGELPNVADGSGIDTDLKDALAQEQRARERLRELRACFVGEYAAATHDQRRILRIAASTPHFRKALLLANPELSALWEGELQTFARAGQQLPDAVRVPTRLARLEFAIFRHLVRAATRPTPHGLWAGVVPVTRAERSDRADDRISPLTLRRATPRYWVTVDLSVFQAVLNAMSRTPRYRWRTRVRLAPGVHRDADGWHSWNADRLDAGWVALPTDSATTAVLDAYADRAARPILPVLARLVDRSPSERDGVASESLFVAAAERLFDCGALHPDLALRPGADVWSVLDEVSGRLLAEDRVQWVETITRLRGSCEHLAARMAVAELDEFRAQLTTIDQQTRAFAQRAGVRLTSARWPIRVDFRPGFTATWATPFIATARTAIAETLGYYAADGGPELLRTQTMTLVLGRQDAGAAPRSVGDVVRDCRTAYLAMSGHDVTRYPIAAGALATLRQHRHDSARLWRERLRPLPDAGSSYTLPAALLSPEPLPGPGGVVVLSTTDTGSLRVEWGRPQPMALASRFGPLLAESVLGAAIREWYDTWPAHARPLEVAGFDSAAPNTAVRPELTGRGGAPPETPNRLLNMIIGCDGHQSRPLLRDGEGGGFVPVYNSAAAIAGTDPVGFVLHRLALGHGWEFLCRRLLSEAIGPGYSPRIQLPSAAVLSPARWYLDAEVVAELLSMDDADRYLAWRARAEDIDLPEYAWAVIESDPEAPPLFLDTASPLACSALWHSIGGRPRTLEFIEVHGQPGDWLACADSGERYASELAVTWHDEDYWRVVTHDDGIG